MKGKVNRIIAMALVMVTLLQIFGGNTVLASGSDADSKATIELTAEGDTEGPTDPVDPEAPEHVIDPDEDDDGNDGTTGNTGRLRIDYVSDFKFGSQDITTDTMYFYAQLINADANHTESGRITVPNFVQVSDLRGNRAGWTLSVKQDDYFEGISGPADGSQLVGARLILDNVTPNTVSSSGVVDAPNRKIDLRVMNASQTVLTAPQGTGNGTHVAHFGDYMQGEKDSALTSVVVEIPEGVNKMIGSYRASLTWQLSDVPGNGDGNNGDGDGEDAELDRIAVTTAPDKISYIEGEAFDPAGMIVTAYYTDDTSEEVSDYTYTPEGSLTAANDTITISYEEDGIVKTAEQEITVAAKALTSIAVTKQPNKVTYTENETFSSTGMEVTAYYNDGTHKPVSGYTYTPNGSLKTTDTAITVSYTEGSVTKTAQQAITVNARVLTELRVIIYPTKDEYTEGEYFDKRGMYVAAIYNNNTSQIVSNYTYTPSGALKTSDTAITLSYTENSVTKKATVPITVKSKDKTVIDSIEDKDEFDEIEIGGDIWIILSKDKTSKTAELLHKKGLSSTMSYHTSTNGTWSWEVSEIRSYLNETFYKSLSADFQKSIQGVPKTTILPRNAGTKQLTEKVYFLSAAEYVKYESAFTKGNLFNYGLNSNITTGWWLRDADRSTGNGAYYVISNERYGGYAGHAAGNKQGVRPAVTVKYKS